MPDALSQTDRSFSRSEWMRICGFCCLIVGAMLFVWQGVRSGGFYFDDRPNIVLNAKVRSLWPVRPFLDSNRPIGLYSFALNYHFSRLEPVAYRLTNLAIHIVNALLLFAGVCLSARLMRRGKVTDESGHLWLAALTALSWGIHPLTTQAVTNIVQRYGRP